MPRTDREDRAYEVNYLSGLALALRARRDMPVFPGVTECTLRTQGGRDGYACGLTMPLGCVAIKPCWAECPKSKSGCTRMHIMASA